MIFKIHLDLHYDNQFLNVICKGQSATPQSHPYTRSAVSTPQSSYLSSNIRAKQIGSHPNLSIEPIIESDSANSSNHHQPIQPPHPSFFYSRSSSAMCQNKALSQLQVSIEQFSQKANLAASAPHLIDDIEQQKQQTETIDKQQQTSSTQTNQTITNQPTMNTTNQTQQTNNTQMTTNQTQQSTNNNQQIQQKQTKPLHPPLPHQSDFASTTSLATSSNISQIPNLDPIYPFRNQLYHPHQYLPSTHLPRNLANINNHFGHLNRRPMPAYNLYRVLYPYKPRQSDELELIAGKLSRLLMF